MATPNVDHLFGIEPWDPRANDATTDAVKTIGDKLHLVADLTGRVAADLGMNGATAEAAAGELDSLTTRVRRSAEGMHSIAQSRTTVTTAGRHAQDTSKQLQKQLTESNEYYNFLESTAGSNPVATVALAHAREVRDAKHAELDAHASKELANLDHVAAAEGKGLPFQPEEQSSASGHGQASESTSGTGGGGRDPRSSQGSASGGAEGHVSSGPGQNAGLPRSATEWRATGLGETVGSPGHANETFFPQRSPSADASIGLQGSHYAPQHVDDHGGALRSGPVRPSGLDSPAVHNPLAVAATMTGGAVGYKVFQAIRAAKAAPAAPVSPRTAVQSGAATRAALSPRGSGILRGATTAARTPVSGTSPSSSRGGASGIARPAAASASGRSSGILRGATTAPRATAASTRSSASRSGIVRGATTASRARTNDPAVSRTNGTGSYNRTGSTVSASRNTAGSQTVSRTTSQPSERTASSSGSKTRTAGGASATRVGQNRDARSTSAGRSLGARAASPSRGADSSNQRVASRQALSGLTGKHARRSDKKKASSGSGLREDKNISAYEPDRRITFLPAGPHPTDNSSR